MQTGRGENRNKVRAAAQTMIEPLSDAVSRTDLPFVEEYIYSICHEGVSERTNRLLVLGGVA